MKTKPNDPIGGCIHGAAVDKKAQGLTKREYSVMMNQAAIIQGLYAAQVSGLRALVNLDVIAVEAIAHTDALFKAMKADNDAEVAAADPLPLSDPLPAPLTPDQM